MAATAEVGYRDAVTRSRRWPFLLLERIQDPGSRRRLTDPVLQSAWLGGDYRTNVQRAVFIPAGVSNRSQYVPEGSSCPEASTASHSRT